ncbi:MAG: hypothetical protein JNK76_15510 [Planctomycetales bacterium]|nr:hypothetical protein [Planctomycetales bacterium]MBN8628762.1 hypothetical protein [Planctomycetota bacterium]
MSIMGDSHDAFHRGTAPIFALLTDDQTRRLAELRGDPELIVRLESLAAKANEGDLSEEERAEYEAYIEANNLLAALQAEARFRLSGGEF